MNKPHLMSQEKMPMDEYISIAEFAQYAHKSPQAIYKQLNNRLNPYIKLVDNHKMLNIRALSDIYGIEVEQPKQPRLTTDSTSINDSVITLLQENQQILKQQLEEKDKTIADLLHKLDQKDLLLSEKERKIDALTGVQAQTLLQLSSDQVEVDQPSEEPPITTDVPDRPSFFDRLKRLFQ